MLCCRCTINSLSHCSRAKYDFDFFDESAEFNLSALHSLRNLFNGDREFNKTNVHS